MGTGLNPTPLERLSHLLRPDVARTVAFRRALAGVLVLLAVASALRPDPAGAYTAVAVAARDLSPGAILRDGDVRAERRPSATLPDGVQTDIAAVLGDTLAGPVRRGEVLTDARVLGSRLSGLSAGPDARIVPLHIADPAVPALIRTGDVVDVLGAPTANSAPGADSRPRVLAADAVVVLVSDAGRLPGRDGDRAVLVALPAPAAHALAAATLVQTVTLTIH